MILIGSLRRTPALFAVALSLLAGLCPDQSRVLSMNCGGPRVVAGGVPFLGDQVYTPSNGAGHVGTNSETCSSGAAVSIGWLDATYSEVNRSARSGFDAYRFDLNPGTYWVRLHLAEVCLYGQGPESRRFSLLLEGQPRVVDLDPTASVGWNYALEPTYRVDVLDGALDIEAGIPGLGSAILNGVEIFEALPSIPSPLDGLTAKSGSGEVILTWDHPNDANLRRVRIERASTASGPWQLAGWQSWGIPRYIDRSAIPGQVAFYRVSPENHFGQLAMPGGVAQAIAANIGDSNLPVIRLTIAPEDLTQLGLDPTSNSEVPATFDLDGVSLPAEVRYRGGGSRRYSKKSWKVKFLFPGTFEGRHEINLKAHFADESLIREWLAEELYAYADIPSAEHRPVHLNINGEFMGVFDWVEQVDSDFLAARDLDTGASIYKAQSNLSVLASAAEYEEHYAKKTNKASGHASLIGFIDLLNQPSTTLAEVADILDLDSYLDYLAIVAVLADYDQISQNYYLVHELDRDLWNWVPWDNDSGLIQDSLDLNHGTSFSGTPPEQWNMLRDWVYRNDAAHWRLLRKVEHLLKTQVEAGQLSNKIDELTLQVFEDARQDKYKWGWERDLLFFKARMTLKRFLDLRSQHLQVQIPLFDPGTPPTVVWINEFMAKNASTLADSAGEFDDWIELVNMSAQAVDLGGHYLTDDLGDPTQWMFPAGTTIAPYSHLVVWADKDPAQGPLHANFKLKTSGEEIGLYAPDGQTLLDFYHYRNQVVDVSEGRVRSGLHWFSRSATPTPGAANSAAGELPPSITWVQAGEGQPLEGQAIAMSCRVTSSYGVTSVVCHYSIGGGPFLPLPMSPLEGDRFGVSIPQQSGGTVVEFYLQTRDSAQGVGTYPTGAPNSTESFVVLSERTGILMIQELCADNDTLATDPQGEYEDYLELFNASDVGLDLSSVSLTDDPGQPDKWQFPAGTFLGPGQRLVVWADSDLGDSGLHSNFSLSKNGEEVSVYMEAGGSFTRLDNIAYEAVSSDAPLGRMAHQPGPFFGLERASPRISNIPDPGQAALYFARGQTNAISLQSQGTYSIGSAVNFSLTGASHNMGGSLLISGQPGYQIRLGCTLLVDEGHSRGTPFSTDGAGQATVAFAIPAHPAFVGVTVYAQALLNGGGCSNGVAITLRN